MGVPSLLLSIFQSGTLVSLEDFRWSIWPVLWNRNKSINEKKNPSQFVRPPRPRAGAYFLRVRNRIPISIALKSPDLLQ